MRLTNKEQFIENKFGVKILTPNGYEDFSGMNVIHRSEYLRVTFSNDAVVKCSYQHPFIDYNGNTIHAVDLKINDAIVSSTGLCHVVNIEAHKENIDLYDCIDTGDTNTYFTNDVLSHNCSFRGSQNTLLSAAALQAMVIHPPIQKRQNLKIYEEVNPEHNYVIAVDVARGVGKDYSAFIVVDVSSKPFKVVATFRDNYIAPMRFPYIIESTAHHYNEAFVLVEINDIGGQVADTLYHELEYENTFMTHIDKRRITLGFGANATIGVRTTTSVKSIGITNIKTLLEEGHFEPRDEDIINEFGTFIPKGKSYEADKDCNDDMVMCCVLFGWMSTQAFFEDLINVSTRDILLSRWRDEMDNDFVPFGFVESEFGMFEGSSALDMDSEDNFWEGF